MTTATDDPTCRAILLDLLGTLDAIQRRDASPTGHEFLGIGFSVLAALKALDAEADLLDRAADAIEAAHGALDALGAPRVVDGHTLTLAERIVWRAKDEAEATDLWVGCLLDRLRAGGVTADQVKAAREWADHVLSK
jgi:hypothetical protein